MASPRPLPPILALALIACASPSAPSTASQPTATSAPSVVVVSALRSSAPNVAASSASAIAAPSATSSGVLGFYDFTMARLNGKPEKLDAYAGKVVLVVNTASECGFTPQYEGLEKLFESLKDKGFTILGFPSNDFGGQEPGDEAHIATFCKLNYGVTFPMFSKVKTKGPDAAPLYAKLGAEAGPPQWNFHKYLIGKDGKLIKAFPSAVTPESDELHKAIDAALAR